MHLPFHIPFLKNSISTKAFEGKKTCRPWKSSGAFKKFQDRTRVASFRNAGLFEYVGTLFELQRFDVNLVLAFPFGHPTDRSNDGHSDESRFCEGVENSMLRTDYRSLTLDEPHIYIYISIYIHFLKLVFTTPHASLYTCRTHLSSVFLNCFLSWISDKAAAGTVEELADFDANYPP